jgi:hypothetical protein
MYADITKASCLKLLSNAVLVWNTMAPDGTYHDIA